MQKLDILSAVEREGLPVTKLASGVFFSVWTPSRHGSQDLPSGRFSPESSRIAQP
jgi:hypothetical protein